MSDLGASASRPGSREPSPSVSAASGFDPSRGERCDECAFYEAHYRRRDEPSWQGDCRRYPPTITGQYKTAPDNSRTQRLGTFPMVEATWVCGEFQARDSDGSPKGGDACGSVHDSAGRQASPNA